MNMITKLGCATALALTLAACSQSTPVDEAMSNDVAMNEASENAFAPTNTSNSIALNATAADTGIAVVGGQAFANDAAVSDAFEIAISKLAGTKASSPAVKSFAAEMVKVHTESSIKLMKAAASATPAITPNPTLPADKQAKVDALALLSGTAFDKAYAAAQLSAHEETLAKVKAYAEAGDVIPLKALAAELVPVVSGHLDMAKKL